MTERIRPWVVAALAYLALALVLTWPVMLDPAGRLVGLATPDLLDTVWLRGLVAAGLDGGHSSQVFAPAGYPVGALLPNRLDHLLGAPLVWLLPFPLSDNAWWWLVLAGNGLAGHAAGVSLGGSHRHGALAGVAVALAEPVLREANLGHAPQALVGFMALAVWLLARCTRPRAWWTHAVGLGVVAALAGLTYWYQALFLALIGAPVVASALARGDHRARIRLAALLGMALGVALVLVAVPLGATVSAWSDLPMTDPGLLPPVHDLGVAVLAPEQRFVANHAGDLLWPLRALPMEHSNRVPLVLLVAAVLGTRAVRERRWRWWLAAALGGVLLMGPALKWGDAVLTLAGHPIPLPGALLPHLSPVLERMHWPQRWGVIVPLALVPLALRAPRPLALAGLLALETVVLSAHAPLAWTPVRQWSGWRSLQVAEGPVLVVPADLGPDSVLRAPAARFADVPLATAMSLPPGTPQPEAWRRWWGPLAPRLSRPGAAEALRRAGVSAVAFDLTPGVAPPHRTEEQLRQTAAILDPDLGPPVDYGSAAVWWVVEPREVPPALEGAEAWRQGQRLLLDERNHHNEGVEFMSIPWTVH